MRRDSTGRRGRTAATGDEAAARLEALKARIASLKKRHRSRSKTGEARYGDLDTQIAHIEDVLERSVDLEAQIAHVEDLLEQSGYYGQTRDAWIDRVLKRLEHSGFYDRPREHGAGTLANILRRVGLGSPRRSRRRRSNSDDDLRRLERQAGQGDESARRRLAAEKRRHGLTDPVPDFIWAENELARVAYSHTMQGDLDFEHADNFRVARSDNEAELLTFIAARDKGCCGSHEWEVTDPEGTRWILGFNYGH